MLYGRLTPETEKYRGTLKHLGRVFEWHEGYFPEEEIQRQYREADYVVLPYARDYSGSSGVFAYAMAYGRPCIATSHGCIGYRVRHFGVGYTYTARATESLSRVLSSLARPGGEAYVEMRERCLAYAAERSIQRHQKVILNLFDKT